MNLIVDFMDAILFYVYVITLHRKPYQNNVKISSYF